MVAIYHIMNNNKKKNPVRGACRLQSRIVKLIYITFCRLKYTCIMTSLKCMMKSRGQGE